MTILQILGFEPLNLEKFAFDIRCLVFFAMSSGSVTPSVRDFMISSPPSSPPCNTGDPSAAKRPLFAEDEDTDEEEDERDCSNSKSPTTNLASQDATSSSHKRTVSSLTRTSPTETPAMKKAHLQALAKVATKFITDHNLQGEDRNTLKLFSLVIF
jgi:hypothetical protein